MDSIVEQADIESAVQRIEALLDASVVVDNAEAFSAKEFEAQYQIVQRGKAWDLSKVNVDKLREEFEQAPFKNIQIADLQAFLQRKVTSPTATTARRSSRSATTCTTWRWSTRCGARSGRRDATGWSPALPRCLLRARSRLKARR